MRLLGARTGSRHVEQANPERHTSRQPLPPPARSGRASGDDRRLAGGDGLQRHRAEPGGAAAGQQRRPPRPGGWAARVEHGGSTRPASVDATRVLAYLRGLSDQQLLALLAELPWTRLDALLDAVEVTCPPERPGS